LAGGLFLLGNDDWGSDITDEFEHEDGEFFGIFEALEEEEGFSSWLRQRSSE